MKVQKIAMALSTVELTADCFNATMESGSQERTVTMEEQTATDVLTTVLSSLSTTVQGSLMLAFLLLVFICTLVEMVFSSRSTISRRLAITGTQKDAARTVKSISVGLVILLKDSLLFAKELITLCAGMATKTWEKTVTTGILTMEMVVINIVKLRMISSVLCFTCASRLWATSVGMGTISPSLAKGVTMVTMMMAMDVLLTAPKRWISFV